jgi:two-component system, NarL family, response regulator LiaR
LVLTAYDDPAYVHALLDAGADGFVLKTAEFTELFRALQDVAVGRTAFNAEIMAKAAQYGQSNSALIEGMTDREIEILSHAARGLTNKQIAKDLFISDRTVQGHLQNIYQKLHVATRTEAVTAAVTRGLITLSEGGQS